MKRIISYYALSEAFREKLTLSSQDECVILAELRNLGLSNMLSRIRALKADELVVAIETDNARTLAGPLLLVGAISGSRNLSIVWPDGTNEAVGLRQVFRHILKMGIAQITSRIAYRNALTDMKKYAAVTSVETARSKDNSTAILYLDANLSFGLIAGGALGHTKGVIDGLVAAGYSVDYASVKNIPTDIPGTRWRKMPSPELYAFPPELNYYHYNREFERRALAWAREIDAAFMYQRMSLHNFSGARIRKVLNIPLVLEFNGSEAWAAENWGQKLVLHDAAVTAEIAALRNADLIITVSDALADDLRAYGVEEDRIVVYPNCIDPAVFDPDRFTKQDNESLRARWGIPADALVATFIGTFGTWHGTDFLAAAIRRMALEMPQWLDKHKLHFLLVGDGLRMKEVRSALSDFAVASRVTLTGLVPQSEAPAYLAASDIFLSPHLPNKDGSAFLGSPTKLFEYMAMARPIVASDLDQIGDVLRQGSDAKGALARLFTPADQDEFVSALQVVVEDFETARVMAKRARAEALAKYTWQHHVGVILDKLK